MQNLLKQTIIIDEQFQFLLPTLDEETYRLLEENILEFGVREPLVLWKGILIDGYNRYRICTEHNLEFNTVEMEFENREEVLIWIISNQISRRNMTPMQMSYFRGLHYMADKKSRGGDRKSQREKSNGQNDHLILTLSLPQEFLSAIFRAFFFIASRIYFGSSTSTNSPNDIITP